MMLIRSVRRDPKGISTFYGAFAVVLVSSVVVGVVLAAPGPRSSPQIRDGTAADQFLGTLLASTIDQERTTVARAISIVCFTGSCSAVDITRDELGTNLTALATPLAKALGRHFELVLSNATGPILRVGDLAKGESATASAAQFYHARSASYLTLALLLGAD